MVNKDGQYKAKLPEAYKTKGKKKNVSIDGDKRKKCPVCGKNNRFMVYAKPQSINEHDPTLYRVSKCLDCKFTNLVPITRDYESVC